MQCSSRIQTYCDCANLSSFQRSHTPRTRCSSYPPTHRLPPSRPYSHHTETIAHDPRLHESDARPHGADHRKRSTSQIYSFDVLRSDPMSSSLQHLTSSGNPPNHPSSSQQHLGPTSSSPEFRVSVPPTAAANIHSPQGQRSGPQRTDPDPAIPAMISFPVSRPPASSKPSSKQTPSEEASDGESPGECAGKKHICPTCLKRFNRPSSLRIHVNTHTGATRKRNLCPIKIRFFAESHFSLTAFRCPWPNCGREFNVNSNMRRHYRNHTTPGFSRVQPTDNRRKRRRVDALISSHSMPSADQVYHRKANLMPSPPISHFSTTDDSDSELERDEYDSHHHHRLPPYPPHVHVNNAKRDHKYNPSAPYMHSLSDTRVSTALRPAYHS